MFGDFAEIRSSAMDTRTASPTADLLDRLRQATNAHDLDALAACFHVDFDSTFPAHPERAFRGQAQMRQNWEQIFAAVPDIESHMVRSAANEGTAWAEWEWHGTRRDGAPFAMRGVTIQGVRDGKIAWARLYMEPVQAGGPGAEDGVRQVLNPTEST
jgi:ketosteroid isomerase-like protein